jgi:hypothetical protein
MVELLHLCRAKLIKEALVRDPHLSIIVAHANLLETLLSDLGDKSLGRNEDWKPDCKSSSDDSSFESNTLNGCD